CCCCCCCCCCLSHLLLFVTCGPAWEFKHSSPWCIAPIQLPYRRAPHRRQTNSLVPECSIRGAGNANPLPTPNSTKYNPSERCIGLTAAFSSSQILMGPEKRETQGSGPVLYSKAGCASRTGARTSPSAQSHFTNGDGSKA
ncbi:hypothetical protein CABS01_04120, partial [Colletotrichum abscissum]